MNNVKSATSYKHYRSIDIFLLATSLHLPIQVRFFPLYVDRVDWVQPKPRGEGEAVLVRPPSHRGQHHSLEGIPCTSVKTILTIDKSTTILSASTNGASRRGGLTVWRQIKNN